MRRVNDAVRVYELQPIYDSRKSFYQKAHVAELAHGRKVLISYTTQVAEITADGEPIIYGKYSSTTTRHQKEFLRQNGFPAENLAAHIPTEEDDR